jgi:hypothetical protein
MSDYITTIVPFKDREYTLQILSGVVVDTETRSDTHVYGGGNNRAVSSYVEITKDIWIKGKSGKEYRYQFGDMPVRAGHVVHVGLIDDKVVIFWNRDKYWFIGDYEFIQLHKGLSVTLWLLVLVPSLTLATADLVMDSNHQFFGIFISSIIGFGIFFGLIFTPIGIKKRKNYFESFKSVLKEKFFSLQTQMDEISFQLTTQVNPAVVIDSHAPSVDSYCSGCGKPHAPDSKFCGGCGTQLATA